MRSSTFASKYIPKKAGTKVGAVSDGYEIAPRAGRILALPTTPCVAPLIGSSDEWVSSLPARLPRLALAPPPTIVLLLDETVQTPILKIVQQTATPP